MSPLPDSRRLRVLIAHNAYQHRGGEDAVVDAEIALLTSHGHSVEQLRRHNDDITTIGPARTARETLWSSRAGGELGRLAADFRPDVIHVHNSFPLISPSIYWAAAKLGIPVVQTLHNFRLLCPQAMLLRDQKICESCVGHVPWRSVVHACYRGSRVQSAAVATMIQGHRIIGTWRNKVTIYIALNEFCRRKFVEGGLPSDRLRVKPNFVDLEPPTADVRDGFLFVGRLSPEKGLDVLARAMSRRPAGVAMRVAGSGPQRELVDGAAGIELLGSLAPLDVYREMSRSEALVLPSICYESFPRTVVEAYANSLPVIASRMGPMVDLVRDGETGLLFEPGNDVDLAAKLAWARAHPAEMAKMGEAARHRYEQELCGKVNLRQLITIYRDAIALNTAGGSPAG